MLILFINILKWTNVNIMENLRNWSKREHGTTAEQTLANRESLTLRPTSILHIDWFIYMLIMRASIDETWLLICHCHDIVVSRSVMLMTRHSQLCPHVLIWWLCCHPGHRGKLSFPTAVICSEIVKSMFGLRMWQRVGTVTQNWCVTSTRCCWND